MLMAPLAYDRQPRGWIDDRHKTVDISDREILLIITHPDTCFVDWLLWVWTLASPPAGQRLTASKGRGHNPHLHVWCQSTVQITYLCNVCDTGYAGYWLGLEAAPGTVNSISLGTILTCRTHKPWRLECLLPYEPPKCSSIKWEWLYQSQGCCISGMSILKKPQPCTEEMAQRLRGLIALPEVLNSIPSNHMVARNHL